MPRAQKNFKLLEPTPHRINEDKVQHQKLDDGLYRLRNKPSSSSRINQDESNDQLVEQWTPVWTRSNHRRTQHFFLATQLYLIFL